MHHSFSQFPFCATPHNVKAVALNNDIPSQGNLRTKLMQKKTNRATNKQTVQLKFQEQCDDIHRHKSHLQKHQACHPWTCSPEREGCLWSTGTGTATWTSTWTSATRSRSRSRQMLEHIPVTTIISISEVLGNDQWFSDEARSGGKGVVVISNQPSPSLLLIWCYLPLWAVFLKFQIIGKYIPLKPWGSGPMLGQIYFVTFAQFSSTRLIYFL